MNKLISRSFGVRVVGLLRVGFSGLSGVGALLAAHGCVPAMRYEEAQSTAEVEAEGRRRTNEALEQARAEIERLNQEIRARDAKLEQREESIERAKLLEERISKQRDENASLVDQLRADLARAGGELLASGTERTRLEREVELLRAENLEAKAEKDCPAPADPEPRTARKKSR